MMKIALILVVLFVSGQAKGLPFGFYDPYNLDTPDDGDVGNVGQQQNEPGDTPDDDDVGNVAPQQNEPGDTPDDGQEAGGVGVAGQAGGTGTTLAPGEGEDSSSSSSSSEEDVENEGSVGGTGTTQIPAGPIKGAGQNQGGGHGGSSDGNIEAVGGSPYGQPDVGAQNAGDTSVRKGAADPGIANPLKMEPQAVKERKARRSGALVAVSTLCLVAGVAALSVLAYKYKDAITSRLGL